MARSGPNRLHGYLVIDKPAGWTSHDVVGRVRRLTGERKVGHAGTLDPAATGVLPVAVGLATRSLEFLSESSKTYLAEITFGVTTDSYDIDGVVICTAPVTGVTEERIRIELEAMTGDQLQVPPMHSAIRVAGRRLYELARRGEEIEREARAVTLHELRLIDWQEPVATVLVDCSKGTYVRSIARDLGERLGCGAYLSDLVRLRSGPFTLEDAWTIRELSELDLSDEWTTIAIHPDAGAASLDAIVIDGRADVEWSFGRPIPRYAESTEPVRVYNEAGEWLGVAEADPEVPVWRPHKVVSNAA
jgi:tRNA pseudouridine55 synthase